ncbi:hypothetical protein EKG37_17440 [Robertmurraya yapensis]|uniref:Uncharacterized protein n=1 Tax=Bacillus yapensis TaxID=2492960 RepID=A0A3S0L6E2_9BACI|nr:hypothetical protein [Bacillus yapensis]RTR28087.1 hypothetical protein EKG37_17440 [Bacillus yapensis]TKS94329.1 hypothetical protein FAR12_17440 [Bacillus yapensis]
MSLFNRPIQNIKTIDIGAIAWVGFWLGGLFLLIIPVQMYGDIRNAFPIFFSFDFIEKIPAPADSSLSNSFQEIQTSRIEMLNKLYTFFNVSKVIFWIFTIGIIIKFLFKQPKKIMKKHEL